MGVTTAISLMGPLGGDFEAFLILVTFRRVSTFCDIVGFGLDLIVESLVSGWTCLWTSLWDIVVS